MSFIVPNGYAPFASQQELQQWVDSQIEFWIGCKYEDVDKDKYWESCSEALNRNCEWGARLRALLLVSDLQKPKMDVLESLPSPKDIRASLFAMPKPGVALAGHEAAIIESLTEKITKVYGDDFGKYRHRESAKVMLDFVKHDATHHLGDDHRLPVFMVDSIGPCAPLISYNRTVGSRSCGLPCALLWPFDYHVNIARQGLNSTTVDVPFQLKKKSPIVFRGALSGPALQHDTVKSDWPNVPELKRASRLQVVSQGINEKWADFGISSIPVHVKDDVKDVISNDEYAKCVKSPMTMKEQMRHRFILCLEGADVSTSFGWVLASNSVPLHTYPFNYEVWYHNGLTPWIHFVPIEWDASDLKDKMLWCLNNPIICQHIAQAGKEHMIKMCDPNLMALVKFGVVERYGLRLLRSFQPN